MSKRSKAKRRAAALKGWITRRRNSKRKKIIVCGYKSSKQNSFSLIIAHHSRKNLTLYGHMQVIERLLRVGHFDGTANTPPPRDLQWCASNLNKSYFLDPKDDPRYPGWPTRNKKGLPPQHALLLEFNREEP